ncbi:hypothetical protein VMF7928_03358 [Vibrio marisflavi CECT 7928]|uniref:Uncharacterized protein n=1 Tax=Vibrio marisflavi CECT 7928 TaxID=634439 RepID=A0ABN8E620_9VIBR|nr:hypothetical protein VMF7928_03358 [Vibrio marisflavi CECT 7928]
MEDIGTRKGKANKLAAFYGFDLTSNSAYH